MALITEDGTARADAESLCSVADADAYHAGVGNDSWGALATTAKEQALRRATLFMQGTYRARWAGTRVSASQALDWPRAYVPRLDYADMGTTPPLSLNGQLYYAANVVPPEVKRACAELALRSVSGALVEDQGRATVKEKLGPMEVEYDRAAPQRTVYTAADDMLRAFFKATGGGAMRQLVRA